MSLIFTNSIALKKKEFKRCSPKNLNDIIKEVATSLMSLWNDVGIPTLEYQYVQRDLKDLHMKGQKRYCMEDVCYIAKCRCFLKAKTRLAPISKILIYQSSINDVTHLGDLPKCNITP